MLTFIVNQVLLRFLSPELLGISVQLELFMISILYFSRESLRTALQRHTAEPATEKESEKKDGDAGGQLVEGTLAAQSQTVVNLSLLTVPLGVVFAAVLSLFYSRSFASSETAAQPYFNHSIALYTLATLLELVSEPCFALAQQKLLYKLRAGAESAAAFTRCVLTCGLTVYAARVSRIDGGLGPLPFAVGQIGYSVVLLGVYWWRCFGLSQAEGFSLWLRGIESRLVTGTPFAVVMHSHSHCYIVSPHTYHESPHMLTLPPPPWVLTSSGTYKYTLFHTPLSTLTASMWLQSFLKHFLTHLDSLLIAILTSPHDQGIYALAANYGSLLARMLFQPIEEASRNLFAKLLSTTTPAAASSADPAPKVEPENVKSAVNILTTILKLYTLLSLILLALAPPFAPLLLSLLLGSRWGGGGEAGAVLSAYCYYIPLLAINGVTEAFVQSVATKRELAKQSAWMGLFSGLFAGTGWVFLGFLGWGAKGLVVANSVGMVLRVLWSIVFIGGYFARNSPPTGSNSWDAGRALPSPILVAAAVGVGAAARGVVGSGGAAAGLVREIGVGAALGVGLVVACAVVERRFFEECLVMFRSARAK